MEDEIGALRANQTWDLELLPPCKRVVGCRWVFTVKLNPDGSLHCLKARLVVKDYYQAYGIDYDETFSQLPKCPLCIFVLLLLPFTIGRSTNLMSGTPFLMVFLRRRFIWSSHLGLLLRRRPQRYADYFFRHH
ncbi:uncharacterized mitochondrial protein AtMg00820-like [Helianthus annuus]|uniref:uncharacterized mitochondrial protein AtMg00820-like n=1 Tax=Helianthus annuus TaxID=4232 RepID=UPI000B907D72|nr:uncharacterized mitochondrial protein AtMg00820-like [Helianthus annuus]